MSIICSILIPSRGRPERLKKTIRSVRDTDPDGNSEILVRFDDDDTASLAIKAELEASGVIVLVGPRRCGYPSIGEFYAELAQNAAAPWIWIMNDDAHIRHVTDSPNQPDGTGVPWAKQLLQLPLTGVIAQPECYQLGGSKYWGSNGGAFPLVPNGCWSRLGASFLAGAAVDTWLDQLLRVTHGWRSHFLAGVAVVHERDSDDVLAQHRRV